VRTLTIIVTLVIVFAATNLVYQIIRKPTEMLFPVSGALKKLPAETWREYAPLFREYATPTIPPELLAALAQVEGAGDPAAHTYWRWRLTWHPLSIFQPASSAVGMYQMTDGTFAEAQNYCIRNHAVIAAGPSNGWRPCWYTGVYTRLLPSHAIQLTAALLDRKVARILALKPRTKPSPQQVQDLAAIVHLCGAGRAKTFAQRAYQLSPGERCGDHEVAAYVAQVNAMKRQFLRLAAQP
jgi:hypothetical protein